jgi:hypothetical protein
LSKRTMESHGARVLWTPRRLRSRCCPVIGGDVVESVMDSSGPPAATPCTRRLQEPVFSLGPFVSERRMKRVRLTGEHSYPT